MFKKSGAVRTISLMEPTWDGVTHLPSNLGLLRIVRSAFPDARLHYVAGAEQIQAMRDAAPPASIAGVTFVEWTPHQDRDTLPADVTASLRKLRRLPREVTSGADAIVMCSCTATMLTALCWAGLARRALVMLHGNANDLATWRSRNPLRRMFDFSRALPRFCRRGGKVLVMEQRIGQSLAGAYPWMAKNLHCLPHPILPEEAGRGHKKAPLRGLVRIGYAGLATQAKGFPQFLELARALAAARPGVFEFHAIGRLHAECASLDQSVLTTRADQNLSRSAFVEALSQLDYVFAWHNDHYYANAASGVVYDAINLGLPMVARTSAQISEWNAQGLQIGLAYDDLPSAIASLCGMDFAVERERYATQCAHLARIRDDLSPERLAPIFANLMPASLLR